MLRSAASAAKRAVSDLAQFSKPGDKLHGFTLVRAKHVPELELTALHLQHDKTGADYLHVARDDANNVFSIGFRTNPPDDTGVPHILEHTTLCGSHKYPIRDPFFKMMPRTLSNFMNAFTASDHTYYPFATTNAQDFKNLMSVYLDATFNPLLKPSDFAQEGWRIGPENPQVVVIGEQQQPPEVADHKSNKLVFKGVVYNEMKGQMSDANYLFYVRFFDHILPAINNSGGDPVKITDLTYEQLKKFHADHYHPSNAKVFTYGDMPLEDHLKEVDARLAAFERIRVDESVHVPIDLSAGSRDVVEQGPLDPLVAADKQYKTSVSWVLGNTTDVLESFSLSLLSTLLMDGYGSPLYRGLVEEGLGADWSPNAGYDGSGKLGIFSIGLTGVSEGDVPVVRRRIDEILRETRQKGFDRGKINGALHQLELALKHKTARFGMSLLHRLKSKWFVGVDPFDALAWNETIAAFEQELAKGNYFEGLMDKYLLDKNVLKFTMKPSETFDKALAQEEEERLARKIQEAAAKAGQKPVDEFFAEQELALLAEQNKTNTEDLSCLPTVHVKDISRSKEPLVVRDEDASGFKMQWVEAPTNGLTYFRAVNILENIPDELRELIPLFTDSIMRLGTRNQTMEQLEDLIKLKTGGVSVGYYSTASPVDFQQAFEGIIMTGMALDRNVPAMYDIIRTLVLDTDFDSPDAALRIRQLLQASADGLVNEIASSGHSFARGVAEGGLTRNAWLGQQVGGLSQVKLVTSLAGRPETDGLEDVIDKLKQIQQFVLVGSNVRVAITCGVDAVADNTSRVRGFMGSWPQGSSRLSGSAPAPLPHDLKTFYPLPYQVYYGGLALPTTSYTSKDGAPLSLLAQLLTHKHLHHEIREKGGAYGAGAYSRSLDGLFSFYSYRDPNPINTLSVMRNAGRWAMERDWTERDLEEAKISVFQKVDAPKAINSRGMDRFLSGVTEEMKQARREQLLDATKDQIRDVAQRYLVDGLARQAERTAFLGKRQEWVDGSWTVKTLDVKSAEVA